MEEDEEAGGFVVCCPALPGCYSQGDTAKEALKNINEAIQACLESLAGLTVEEFGILLNN
ncbi:MAG: type II toxin-antitoxin system HicB family antitoxin [Candidatus Methanoperedens sp.]|nr:type II toxin-antitoxin system HicB family antitoxin [Candidatus Methanoperedens sp.]